MLARWMKLSFLYDETSIIPNFATNSDAMKVTLDLDQLKNEGESQRRNITAFANLPLKQPFLWLAG